MVPGPFFQPILILQTNFDLEQWSQTHGQQAACGPQDALVRPANITITDKIINFDQIKLISRAFRVNCSPQKLVSNKLRSSEHFFFGMWFSDNFEFETPDLDQ